MGAAGGMCHPQHSGELVVDEKVPKSTDAVPEIIFAKPEFREVAEMAAETFRSRAVATRPGEVKYIPMKAKPIYLGDLIDFCYSRTHNIGSIGNKTDRTCIHCDCGD